MSKRLQVLLDDEELDEIRRIARRRRMTVSEWVRQSLRESRRDLPSQEADHKLAVVREAAAHAYPSADIDRMLEEIEAGYHRGDA